MIASVGVFVGAGLVAALCAVVLHDRLAPAADDALRASSGAFALMAGVLGPTASAVARPRRPRSRVARPVMPAFEHVVSPATGAAV